VAFLCTLASAGCRARSEPAPSPQRAHDWIAELPTVVARPVAPHWSDYVPARIAVDEARTTRVGSPRPGRVTAVQIQRGDRVDRGAELFVIASPSTPEGGAVTVRAPRAGVVVECGVELGGSAGEVAIADLDAVWAVADIADDTELASGARAEVDVAGRTAAGVVVADRHALRVELANPDGVLRLNADARLRWYVAGSATLSVPRTAVVDDGAMTYVYVRRGKELRRQPVIASGTDAGAIAIHRGLRAGDEVVARGADVLDQGIP
jgi:biotin carboxyl carrier protein